MHRTQNQEESDNPTRTRADVEEVLLKWGIEDARESPLAYELLKLFGKASVPTLPGYYLGKDGDMLMLNQGGLWWVWAGNGSQRADPLEHLPMKLMTPQGNGLSRQKVAAAITTANYRHSTGVPSWINCIYSLLIDEFEEDASDMVVGR